MNAPFTSVMPIRFSDQDSMGHVNNAVFVTYLENARVDYWRSRYGEKSTITFGIILGEVLLRYLAPIELKYHQVAVHMGCSRIGGKSFDFIYEMRSMDGSKLFARAKTTQVGFDYETQKSAELPETILEPLRKDAWTLEGWPP